MYIQYLLIFLLRLKNRLYSLGTKCTVALLLFKYAGDVENEKHTKAVTTRSHFIFYTQRKCKMALLAGLVSRFG